MRSNAHTAVLTVLWCTASAVCAACATQRSTTPQGAAQPGTRAVSAGASAAADSVSAAGVDPELLKRYRMVKRGDATLYCRPEILTGTRFSKTVCLTAAELKAEQVHAREMLHSLDEGQPNFCNGKPCTGL